MEESDSDEELIVIFAALAAALVKDDPIPQHTSMLTGAMKYAELLANPNEKEFHVATHMPRHIFLSFLQRLTNDGGLKNGRLLCAGEKLVIFLQVVINYSNREAASNFQHSGSTVSKVFKQVKTAILNIGSSIVVASSADDDVPQRITRSSDFWPWFQFCIGCFDGTHVPAVIPIDEQGPFRNRKGFISQNVFAACNFDEVFTFVLAGWEGSAHDAQVLADAILKGFPIIPGRYYLGDAGFALTQCKNQKS